MLEPLELHVYRKQPGEGRGPSHHTEPFRIRLRVQENILRGQNGEATPEVPVIVGYILEHIRNRKFQCGVRPSRELVRTVARGNGMSVRIDHEFGIECRLGTVSPNTCGVA